MSEGVPGVGAVAAYETGKGRLFRQDGRPMFAGAEQNEHMQALNAALSETIGAAKVVAARVAAEQRTQLSYLEEGDLLDELTSDVQSAARTRLAFSENDAVRLSPAELVTRCRIAAQQGNRATCYLLGRCVGERLQTVLKESRRTNTPATFSMAEREDLTAALTAVRAVVLGETGTKRIQTAKSRIHRARTLQEASARAFNTATKASARLEAEMTARYQGMM